MSTRDERQAAARGADGAVWRPGDDARVSASSLGEGSRLLAHRESMLRGRSYLSPDTGTPVSNGNSIAPRRATDRRPRRAEERTKRTLLMLGSLVQEPSAVVIAARLHTRLRDSFASWTFYFPPQRTSALQKGAAPSQIWARGTGCVALHSDGRARNRPRQPDTSPASTEQEKKK